MKITLTTVRTILVRTEAHASIWSTVINAFVAFHSLEETAMQKWIRVLRTAAAMVQDAHQVQITRISIARVQLATLEDYATKTSTNASFHRRHVGTVQLARTRTGLINAYAQKVTKEKIAPSTLTIVLRFHVRTVALVSMASETTHACATKVSKENIAKLTSTNAFLSHVKTEPPVTNTLTLTLARVV